MNTPGYIYVMRLHVSDHWPDCPFKIGQSVNPVIRRSQLGIVMPYELSVVKWIKTNNMDWTESLWHDILTDYHLQGEWYRLDENWMVQLLITDEMNDGTRHDFWTCEPERRFIRESDPLWFEKWHYYFGEPHRFDPAYADLPF